MRIVIAVLLFVCAPLHAAMTDCASAAAVCERAVPGALALIKGGLPASILADEGDFPGVLRAAHDLQADLSAVAGVEVPFSTKRRSPGTTAIIIGTLGHSARIDRIVRAKRVDVTGVTGRWEGYLLQVIERPEAGIERALLIVGADKRGTIFGIYEVSRRLGVSPWTWWADVPVQKHAALYVALGRFTDAPAVRSRGIFINDEDPALGGWIKATYGGPNHQFYARVFELILRLKGNLLWPAMWGRAFADDDVQNPKLADEYGVIIGTSHHEPMMRAHVEWKRHGKGPWDYERNRDALRAFWRRGIERMDGYESIVTLGMRGDGDEAMRQDTAIDLLERILADQRSMLAKVARRPVEHSPQVWALYKEVQDYFDVGMRVPDDVTLLFSDDNWGNLRRLPKLGERRGGGYGVYYHFDYVGGPRNYKWINTNQIERVWEQMHMARAYGADRLWIVNVGDLKPMEFPISFFLDYAWNPEAMPLERLPSYAVDWAAQQFGPTYAADIGELLTRYTQYNARRKPELLSADTYSLVNFHEAERIAADWDALADRAQRVRAALPAVYFDAYYQLVEYPVLASANINKLYVSVASNRLYATQGRVATNAEAAETQRLFKRDAELARVYEQEIAGGKWIHMMSQPRIGYTGWQQPEKNISPEVKTIAVPTKAAMGVALEGDARAWPGTKDAPKLPPLDPFNATSREIVLFNRGATPVRFIARPSQRWLRVLPTSGDVGDQTRLRVEVDWNAVPEGQHSGRVTLRGNEGTEVKVEVPVAKPSQRSAITGFVEADGLIAIEAEHYSRAIAPQGLEWRTIPNLGRTLSGVIPWPVTAPVQQPGGESARLEYPIWLTHPGEVQVRVVLSPSLDFQHRGGLRYAVSIGDEAPQIVTLRADPAPGGRDFAAWSRAVSDNVYVASSNHGIERAGAQVLKLWMVDPGLVFQRVELWRGESRASYLGPPESVRR